MDKEDAVHIHTMECYSAMRKEGNLSICINIDGFGGHYAKGNMSERERKMHMISLICGILEKLSL